MYEITLKDKSTVTVEDIEPLKHGRPVEDTDGCLIQWCSVESICEATGSGYAKVGSAKVGTAIVK